MTDRKFRVLYSDIGGVLGTNGWDTDLRRRLCSHFGLSATQIDPRHRLMFDSFERGHITFEEYLQRVFFSVPRAFTWQALRDYTYNESQPWPENIAFFSRVKQQNDLKLAFISNEGQGITEHRVKKFGLANVADFLVISHFVHLRKPDHAIWKLALDLAQVSAAESIYVDDREMFVDVARDLGFTAVHHTSLAETQVHFARLGLTVE
jgi:putative hydrolase of the HAD superfamily